MYIDLASMQWTGDRRWVLNCKWKSPNRNRSVQLYIGENWRAVEIVYWLFVYSFHFDPNDAIDWLHCVLPNMWTKNLSLNVCLQIWNIFKFPMHRQWLNMLQLVPGSLTMEMTPLPGAGISPFDPAAGDAIFKLSQTWSSPPHHLSCHIIWHPHQADCWIDRSTLYPFHCIEWKSPKADAV